MSEEGEEAMKDKTKKECGCKVDSQGEVVEACLKHKVTDVSGGTAYKAK